jgi:hypothetical protein
LQGRVLECLRCFKLSLDSPSCFGRYYCVLSFLFRSKIDANARLAIWNRWAVESDLQSRSASPVV